MMEQTFGLVASCVAISAILYCSHLKASLRDMEQERQVYQSANQANIRALELCQENLHKTQTALSLREEELKSIERKANALNVALQDVLKKDSAAKDWADMPVPDSVSLLLSGASGENGGHQSDAASGTTTRNSRSKMDGKN